MKILTLGALLLLLADQSQAGGIVTSCTESDLRAGMAGGGTVTFACDGTIVLSATITNFENLTLDAAGHQVSISGNNAVRVFFVQTNTALTLLNLRIMNGRPQVSDMMPGEGGGVLNLGVLNATDCMFKSNSVVGQNATLPDSGAPAYGGAIANTAGATLNVSRCSFVVNRAVAGSGVNGLDGQYFSSPTSASNGGVACGGAIYNSGTVSIEASLFLSNSVTGGTGGAGGNGALVPYGTTAAQSGSFGGNGGSSAGSAVFNAGQAGLVNCTFAANEARGGNGGPGGRAGIWETPHWAVGFPGGPGGSGGSASGTICDGEPAMRTLRMTNCTVVFNSGSVGTGGAGGGGSIGNPNGAAGLNGTTNGAVHMNGAVLVNMLLASNSPAGNCSGNFTDAGHNLSSDASGPLTNSTSFANLDPKLKPLVVTVGTTAAFPLGSDSPAIDAADTGAAPATDQRGVPRPFGLAADIGAYEYAVWLNLFNVQSNTLELRVRDAAPGRSCQLLAGSTLASWQPVKTNLVDADGMVFFQVDWHPDESQQFFKALVP